MTVRIIISDEFGSHGLDIKAAIIAGYGSDISSEISIIAGWNDAVSEAKSNLNVIALIRSTQEILSSLDEASLLYTRVQTFFPLGGSQNTFDEVSRFSHEEPPLIVTCGAGDFTNPLSDRNNTAYGNGLEFWDHDLVVDDSGDASSFSNGIILGKLLKIKDTLNCSWWEARHRARMTASRQEPNRPEGLLWTKENGYGKINVNAAIAYNGAIPVDPYLPVPVPQESVSIKKLFIWFNYRKMRA